MIIDQERIEELVRQPTEGLNVEVKRWINPSEPESIAKIVRACLAIRNRNGGYLIIGFDNITLQPDTQNEPPDIQVRFHVDKIQGLVSQYSSEPFEIGVGFAQRDGHRYPVIVVPAGVTTPTAAKADLKKDGHFFIRESTVYFRTLRANGTPSTAAARPEDWREIVQICFDNREADIGRFLRRQLAGHDVASLAAALAHFASMSNVQPPPSLKEQSFAYLDDGKARFASVERSQELGSKPGEARLIAAGQWEVALIIDPAKDGAVADRAFMNTISSSNPNLTGWPIWMDTRGVVDQRSRPVVRDGAWEALIVAINEWSDHLDFMRLDPSGRFYLLRNLPDDLSDKVQPKSCLDPNLVLRRVTEAIAVGLAIAKALSWDVATAHLGFSFRWTRLKGRQLEHWGESFPSVHGGRAQDDQAKTFVDVQLDTPPAAIAPIVNVATRPLFALFEGASISMEAVEDVVRRVLNRSR